METITFISISQSLIIIIIKQSFSKKKPVCYSVPFVGGMLIAVQKSCRVTLKASCQNIYIKKKKFTVVYYFDISITPTPRSILFDKKTRIKIREFWVVVAEKPL